jgi:hypothetical protein
MKNGLNVTIEHTVYSQSINIWITDVCGNKIKIAKSVVLEFEDWDPGLQHNPTLSLPAPEGEQFLQSLADQLSETNVKAKNERTLEGQLKAAEKHLEDMRRIALKEYPKLEE